MSQQCCLEAVNALSAMVTLDPDSFCKAAAQSGPLLVAHLSMGSGAAIAERSAWLLGNKALKPVVPLALIILVTGEVIRNSAVWILVIINSAVWIPVSRD